jgi:predicted Zn-dependent protease with MMP-like domain
MEPYSSEQFEELVAQALAELPAEFRQKLDNISIVVKDWPSRRDLLRAGLTPGMTLLGLYQGVPLTERGQAYSLVPPDRIILFRRPIEAAGRTADGIRRQIRRTVLHEIAHHFGISDQRLRELGAY